jgi:Siphovirus Gp157
MGSNFVSVDRLRIEAEALLRNYPELGDDDVARLDTLEAETEIREVLIHLARSLHELTGMEHGLSFQIDELNKRLGRFNARHELIRALIFKVMESADLKKIELPEATFSLKNNPKRLVGDADAKTLPDDLCHIKRTVNRTAVREALEAGGHVEGFQLSNAQPSLTVRVK